MLFCHRQPITLSNNLFIDTPPSIQNESSTQKLQNVKFLLMKRAISPDMSGAKKCLDPLVECSEIPETSEYAYSEDDAAETLLEDPLRATTSKSTEAVTQQKNKDRRKKKTGSRLSLASLFSLNSQGAKDPSRERSKSGWSYGDDSSVVMSSLSATDLRTSGSASIDPNRRTRGSDGGSSHDEVASELNDILLVESDHDEECEQGKKKSRCKLRECPLCCMRQPLSNFPKLVGCTHRSCRLCLMQYVEMEIMENRVEVSCPECTNNLHPMDIKKLVGGRSHLIQKYEQFSVRRFLLTEPDARWCPAPDCGYAVIANSCAACPQLKCARESCGALFCYHCKGAWHANQTCDEARRTRGMSSFAASISRRITNASLDTQLKPGDIKACPRCHTYIVKMDDGSCNHMVCAMCSAEFCWLCLKEISDLHYLSPTGCTFWGKKPWTRKKKLLWQIGTLIGAPVGIALIAGLSIPGIIFGVPVFVGRKVHQRFLLHSKARRRAITAACVAGSLVVSPVLAVMAVGVGVPIMLAYVYGVVPLSLCRNGGCGLSDSSNPQDLDGIDDEEIWRDAPGMERSQLLTDSERQLDVTSIAPAMSIQSGSVLTNPTRLSVKNVKRARSPSVSSSSGRTSPDARCNYEEASTKAMAGSHCHYYYDDKSVHTMYSGHEAISYCEEVASTKALAGSVHDSKSLCESTGRHKHDFGCDGNNHSCACTTPSTSSAEHNNKSQADDAVIVLRRKLVANRPHNVNIASTQTAPEVVPEVRSPSADTYDIEAQLPSTSRTVQHLPAPVMHSDSREEQDPFRIRTLLDNMKQMVAADVPQEKPYEPTSARPAPIQKVRRSGSGKSLATVATHSSVPEVLPVRTDSVTTPKRGFFQNLFRRSKS